MPESRPQLGSILLTAKAVSAADLDRALAHAQSTGCRIGSALIELRLVGPDKVAAALAHQLGVAPATVAQLAAITDKTRAILTGKQAAQFCAMPLGRLRGSDTLAVAMRDPHDLETLDGLRFATGGTLQVAVASEHILRKTIELNYSEAPPKADRAPAASAAGSAAGAPLASSAVSVPTAPAAMETAASDDGELSLAPLPATERAKRGTLAPLPGTMAPLPGTAGAGAPTRGSAVFTDGRPADGGVLVKYRNFIIAGVVVAAALVAFKVYRDKREKNRIVSIGGMYLAKHPNLEIDMPDSGWQYRAKEDTSDSQNGVVTKGSTFFRGPDPDDPDAAMVLLRANGRFPAISEQMFNTIMSAMQAGLSRGMQIRNVVTSNVRCERTTVPTSMAAICHGNGMLLNRPYDLVGHFWMADDANLMFAFFLSKPGMSGMEAEWNQVLTSLRPVY